MYAYDFKQNPKFSSKTLRVEHKDNFTDEQLEGILQECCSEIIAKGEVNINGEKVGRGSPSYRDHVFAAGVNKLVAEKGFKYRGEDYANVSITKCGWLNQLELVKN